MNLSAGIDFRRNGTATIMSVEFPFAMVYPILSYGLYKGVFHIIGMPSRIRELKKN